jgi:sterol desaturase/sphingolipid hydroxylase (fatty acid hydroxylase superfamily)
MPELPAVTMWAIPLFIGLVVLEWLSYRWHPDEEEVGYAAKDTATSLAMGVGSIGWDLLWKLPVLAGYLALYEVAPVHWEFHWWQLPLLIIAQDFLYYWSHWSHHVVRILWASHVVHHSSQRFNLSTALRQPWTGLTSAVFYIPMILAGVPPSVLFFVQGLNLLYQFWIHTERIDRLARPIEWLFNTPSHHRVHHAANGSYLDRNFGGIFIVWDRMFGTFERESIRCEYGLTKNIATYNPLRVAYHEYAAIARDVRNATRWQDRLSHLVRGPGWRPDHARESATVSAD